MNQTKVILVHAGEARIEAIKEDLKQKLHGDDLLIKTYDVDVVRNEFDSDRKADLLIFAPDVRPIMVVRTAKIWPYKLYTIRLCNKQKLRRWKKRSLVNEQIPSIDSWHVKKFNSFLSKKTG